MAHAVGEPPGEGPLVRSSRSSSAGRSILTIYNRHTEACGPPPAVSKESPDVYVGYFENRYGEQWIFTYDRGTRTARLRGGDAHWAATHVVLDGEVDGLILGAEESTWLRACWEAAGT